MNCDEYLPLISGHLDGVNSEIEERLLQEHLKACEACRALLSQMEVNDALLKSSAAQPPSDLTARIMRQVRSEKQVAPSRMKRWIPVIASGVAAAALLSLVVWGKLPFTAATSMDSAAAEAAFENAHTASPAEPAEDYDGSLYYRGSEADLSGLSGGSIPDSVEQDYGFVPEFPAYAYSVQSSIVETTATTVKRGPMRYTQSAPMLIVWDTDTMDALAAFEPEDLNECAPLTANLAPSLYARFQAILPVLRTFDQISPDDGFGITIYTVPYETLIATFDECIGVYENAIYYPAALTSPEACSVVLIDISE